MHTIHTHESLVAHRLPSHTGRHNSMHTHGTLTLIFLLLTLIPHSLHAQYDPAFNHFWTLQTLYNPAASGLNAQIDVKGAYAMQMMGYENSPATMVVTADMPLWFIGPAHAVGAGFTNDKIGLFSHKRFYIQYAIHLKLWGGRLSAGIRPALMAETFDGSGVDTEQANDPAFPSSEVNGTAFDLDAGIRFDTKRWYAGFAVTHTLAPTVELGDEKVNQFSVPQTYYLTGGYNIQLRNPLLTIQTDAIVRSDITNWRADIAARLIYQSPKGKLYAGAAYSPTVSATVCIGGDFHGIQLGYCYEFFTSGIGALQGTHEVTIAYTTNLDLFKKGRNRHQSIRIL